MNSSRGGSGGGNRDRSSSSEDRFTGGPAPKATKESGKGIEFCDYKDHETLRRMMTPNGKIYGRKRLGTNARQQRMVARAIKRARFMGLLPFTSATL
ncbi:MAG: 30S ribosomal protein S18 [Phycisphaerales bacterium]|nr:30S ribosomal protein S18 [Phycisphaerales bacterium]